MPEQPAYPYTPETLAQRWHCSAETVRDMVRRRVLPAFRVGRMMRITQAAVEEYECKTSESDDSKEGSLSSGMRMADGAVIALRQTRKRMQSAKRAT